jgi:hypothetical protein
MRASLGQDSSAALRCHRIAGSTRPRRSERKRATSADSSVCRPAKHTKLRAAGKPRHEQQPNMRPNHGHHRSRTLRVTLNRRRFLLRLTGDTGSERSGTATEATEASEASGATRDSEAPTSSLTASGGGLGGIDRRIPKGTYGGNPYQSTGRCSAASRMAAANSSRLPIRVPRFHPGEKATTVGNSPPLKVGQPPAGRSRRG